MRWARKLDWIHSIRKDITKNMIQANDGRKGHEEKQEKMIELYPRRKCNDKLARC